MLCLILYRSPFFLLSLSMATYSSKASFLVHATSLNSSYSCYSSSLSAILFPFLFSASCHQKSYYATPANSLYSRRMRAECDAAP